MLCLKRDNQNFDESVLGICFQSEVLTKMKFSKTQSDWVNIPLKNRLRQTKVNQTWLQRIQLDLNEQKVSQRINPYHSTLTFYLLIIGHRRGVAASKLSSNNLFSFWFKKICGHQNLIWRQRVSNSLVLLPLKRKINNNEWCWTAAATLA